MVQDGGNEVIRAQHRKRPINWEVVLVYGFILLWVDALAILVWWLWSWL